MRQLRSGGALGALSALLAGAAFAPATANAGAYWVSACGADGVNQAISVGIPPSLAGGVESTMNCNDKGWGGHNAMSLHVREFADGQPTPQFLPFNESANMFISAPGGAFLEGVYTEASRLATSYPNATGMGARVMAVNRSWCRLQGTGGSPCPEAGGGADNSQNIPWHQGNYPSRGNGWYGTSNGTGTTALAFGVVCDGGSSAAAGQCYRTRQGSSAGVALTSASIKVRDDQAPTISAVSGGITGGKWRKSGAQNFKVTAWDNTGISRFETYVDGQPFHTFYQGCDYTKMKPCEDRTLEADAVVGNNFDGLHDFTVRAVSANTDEIACAYDCADSYVAAIWTDGTAPGSAVTANNNAGWRNVNSFQLASQTPASENDPDGSGPRHNSPITGRVVTVCPGSAASEGDAGCVTKNQGTGDAVAAPGQGSWWSVVRLVDEAGNVGAPSNRVAVQFDATAPAVAVNQARGGFTIANSDPLSGPANVTYRVDGNGPWVTNAGVVADGSAGLRVTTVAASAGQHYVEVKALDNAGNTTRDAQRFDFTVPSNDGNVKTLDEFGPQAQTTVVDRGPVNGVVKGEPNGLAPAEKATLTAWFVKRSKSKVKKPNLSVRTIGEKNGAVIEGLLLDAGGKAIANARIDLGASIAGGRSEIKRGVATTSSEGNFTITLPKGQTSRDLTVAYMARVNDVKPAGSAGLRLIVKARASFTAHKPRVGIVKFTGFVSSGYLTKAGTRVEIKAFNPKTRQWNTIDSVRTDQKGRWVLKRRFTQRATLRMFAWVPSNPAYAYKGASSRIKTVRIR